MFLLQKPLWLVGEKLKEKKTKMRHKMELGMRLKKKLCIPQSPNMLAMRGPWL